MKLQQCFLRKYVSQAEGQNINPHAEDFRVDLKNKTEKRFNFFISFNPDHIITTSIHLIKEKEIVAQ